MMNKNSRKLAAVLALAVLCAGLNGCKNTTPAASSDSASVVSSEAASEAVSEVNVAESTAEVENYADSYASLLDSYYELICTGNYTGIITDDDAGGVYDVRENSGAAEASKNVGYCIQDFSGDGVPELAITDATGTEIYAFYALKDGEPTYIFGGWYRTEYNWLGDNRFYCGGSSSADSFCFGDFELSQDGTEMIWDDFYFTDADGTAANGVSYYSNKNGTCDTETSEKLTDEEVENIENFGDTKSLQVTTFADTYGEPSE